MTEFCDSYDPYRMDVVYGTSGSRDTYLISCVDQEFERQVLKGNMKPAGKDGVPEPFRAKTMDAFVENGVFINQYNDPITNLDFQHLDLNNLKYGGKRFVSKYITSLNRTRYKIDGIGAATLKSLAKGDSSLKALSGVDKIPPEDLSNLAMMLAVRRSCKYGIEYLSSAKTGKSVVHYILDEIIMADVVNKTDTYVNFMGKTGLPITTSELRFVFRNWHFLHRRWDKKLFFYLDQKKVPPPWTTTPLDWIPYAEHLIGKLTPHQKTKYSDAIKVFESYRVKYPARAVRSFFTIERSKENVGDDDFD